MMQLQFRNSEEKVAAGANRPRPSGGLAHLRGNLGGYEPPFAALQSKIETFARSPNAPPVMLFSMIVLLKLLKPRLMADEYSAGLGGEDEPVVGADDAESESPADEAEEAAVDDGD
ncbi:MAG: hypothetical protein VW935_07965, partial [Novosphingobium sp.]